MKKLIKIQMVWLILIAVLTIPSHAQKKNRVRLSAEYISIVGGSDYFEIKARAKGENGYEPVKTLTFNVYADLSDSLILIGDITTDSIGVAQFDLTNKNLPESDEDGFFNYSIRLDNNDKYSNLKKGISFKRAIIEASIITKDSSNYINARLIDTATKEPVVGEKLLVRVDRLFRPLNIGKGVYRTNESGTILAKIDKGIPGIDGILNLEVVLEESDIYGTVKLFIEAAVGKPIVENSTFDERTLWSPPGKTPWLLLVVPNIIIVSIWLMLLWLTFNLYRISKSKLYNHENN